MSGHTVKLKKLFGFKNPNNNPSNDEIDLKNQSIESTVVSPMFI